MLLAGLALALERGYPVADLQGQKLETAKVALAPLAVDVPTPLQLMLMAVDQIRRRTL